MEEMEIADHCPAPVHESPMRMATWRRMTGYPPAFMAFPIHEKIELQLSLSRRRKKDLASFLGIAPQTMTDICKGRSAVTLTHLRGLVRYFGLRGTYWLDDERRDPQPLERLELFDDSDLRHLEAALLAERPSEAAARELASGLKKREELFARHNVPAAGLRRYLERVTSTKGQSANSRGDARKGASEASV